MLPHNLVLSIQDELMFSYMYQQVTADFIWWMGNQVTNKMNGNDQQSGHCRSLDGWWGLVSGDVQVSGWPNALVETRSPAQKPAHKDLSPKWPKTSLFADAPRNALTGPETCV